jgi:hypothetical protein
MMPAKTTGVPIDPADSILFPKLQEFLSLFSIIMPCGDDVNVIAPSLKEKRLRRSRFPRFTHTLRKESAVLPRRKKE